MRMKKGGAYRNTGVCQLLYNILGKETAVLILEEPTAQWTLTFTCMIRTM